MTMRVRKPLIAFIAILQSILCLTHLFLYETWTFSPVAGETHGAPWIKLVFGLLSVSFIVASLLALHAIQMLPYARFTGLLRFGWVW
jgi:uncharacterized membrane protein YdcZ (DUF606 family)